MSVRSAMAGGGIVAAAWAAVSLSSQLFQQPIGHAVTADGELIAVVDADTIAIGPNGKTHLRLVGFDAPEIFKVGCPGEREQGLRAANRLIQLTRSGTVRLHRIGKKGRWNDLARLTIDGEEVGPILIREGLARHYHGEKRKSWCD